MLPVVVTSQGDKDKEVYLSDLVDSLLLKDILQFEDVKGAQVLIQLLRLLSFQVGQLVSLNELATQTMLSVKTVARYLDLLEKSFIITPLTGYSNNLRSEMREKNKYYFFDNGIRNALIGDFRSLDKRDDIGALWENFLMIERQNRQAYLQTRPQRYFWRTWEGNEIDLIEIESGKMSGYEFKWGDKVVSAPKQWQNEYSQANFQVINQENYLGFVS